MYGQEASNKLALAYASVTNQIAEEFQAPRIKQTVESVAKSEAKSILEREVEPVVASFRQNVLFIRTVALLVLPFSSSAFAVAHCAHRAEGFLNSLASVAARFVWPVSQ